MFSPLADPPVRRFVAVHRRLMVAACVAIGVLAGVSGCEFFTSERLEKLKPGARDSTDPDGNHDLDFLSTDSSIDDPNRPTAADIVGVLERIIRGNQSELDALETKLQERDEDTQARDVFQHLDDLLKSVEREGKRAEAENQAERVQELTRQADGLKHPWNLARERLNLDLRDRMLSLERLQILRSVLTHDQARLDAILATGDLAQIHDDVRPPAVLKPTPSSAAPTETPAAPAPIVSDPPTVPKAAEAKPEEAQEAAKSEAAKPQEPAEEKADATKAEPAPSDEAEKAKLPPSKALISAKQELEAKSTTVQTLQERTMSLDDRVQKLARSIELVKALLELSRRGVDNAVRTREYLVAQMQSEKPSSALQAWTHDDGDALGGLDRRIRVSGEALKNYESRLQTMLEEQALVLRALQETSRRVESAQKGLEKTQETVEALQSPFSSDNIKRWLAYRAPPMLATLIVMTLLYIGVSQYAHRIVRIFASRGIRGSKVERDNRTDTLVSVLQNTGSGLVLLGGGSTLLSQAGIPVTPLLGGAAVAGVAVAFGAQNLIKDFFYGFMILLENQYKLKDIVKIGNHSGQVEQITLRMTALRDSDGGLHFLPNGATNSVVNLTHGWSSASFEVRISWYEDVERVITIIQDLGKQLRQDPAFRLMIVDDLNMMGVDSLTDNAVVLLFSIKTLPLQQWNVKREFLRRLKKRFQEKNVLLPGAAPPPPPLPEPSTDPAEPE